ncbi:MAG: hypothetical protein V1866_02770 [archaeon]
MKKGIVLCTIIASLWLATRCNDNGPLTPEWYNEKGAIVKITGTKRTDAAAYFLGMDVNGLGQIPLHYIDFKMRVADQNTVYNISYDSGKLTGEVRGMGSGVLSPEDIYKVIGRYGGKSRILHPNN